MISGGGGDFWLIRILSRIFRCSHQRQTRPITPRGGGQTYAVCLDCGMRLAYDLSAMGVVTPVHGSSLDRQAPEVGKGKLLDISVHESMPAAPEPRETMWADSRRVHRDFGTPAVLSIGALSLAGGLFYLLEQPPAHKNLTAPKQARPPISARSVKLSRGLRVAAREPDNEVAPAYESTAPQNSTPSTEPNALAGNEPIEPDSTSASAAPESDPALYLGGHGSVIVLGREAGAALELSQHPERLSKLIQAGSLFTVPRGTAIKLLQGNRVGDRLVIKVRIMAGSMLGQEGWAQPGRAQSPSADSVKSSPRLPAPEGGMDAAPYSRTTKMVANATAPGELSYPSGETTIAPESGSISAVPQSDQVSRLEGKGSVIVLGREARDALELSQHPESLSKLIERGSLFAVARGTAIRLLQGNRLGNKFVIKVRIMQGPKAGQEGWAQPPQVSP
jgi:hypothetical protein